MLKNISNIKILAAVLLSLTVHFTFGSFTGTVDERNKNNKFTLKNLNKISKNYSLSSLRGGFQFKGSQELTQQPTPTGVEINSMIRLEKGTTTYIYPYTYKVKVPKFKTPTPPPDR